MENRNETDNEDKTEEASDERKKQFREEGKIIQPKEAISAIGLISCSLALPFLTKSIVTNSPQLFSKSFSIISNKNLTVTDILNGIYAATYAILPSLVGFFAITMMTPVFLGLCITKFHWSGKKISVDFSKLNFFAGIKRFFSFGIVSESAKYILKTVIMVSVLYLILKTFFVQIVSFYDLSVPLISLSTGKFIYKMLVFFSLGSFVFAAIDYFFQWRSIENELKMTKQEVKDETKQHEGNPQIKSQRRRMARDFIFKNNVEKSSKATFIVTNPEHFAIAIKYTTGMSAPIVLAKGQDFLALRIREIAKKNDIMIVENKPLARTLYKTTKVGKEIPASLYSSVIEVMKYIYRVRGAQYFEKKLI